MKSVVKRFIDLPLKQKILFITAGLLTIALCVSIPVYAWFTRERKAAEMFKVEYPNSLYINAAHREDRIYFDLDGIDVNNYIMDKDGNIIYKYYRGDTEITQAQYNEDPTGCTKVAQKTTKYRYVFAVSGDNTTKFTLQMAHTNNNMFSYTVYAATQYDTSTAASNAIRIPVVDEETGEQKIDAESGEPVYTAGDSNRIIEWTQHANSHNDNIIQVEYDEYTKSDTSPKYYVMATTPINGNYLNNNDNDKIIINNIIIFDDISKIISNNNLANDDDKYYKANFGTNSNVESHAIPSYWQADISANVTGDTNYEKGFRIDSNKRFVKYFIVEVDCSQNQGGQATKETDLIYFSVERKG